MQSSPVIRLILPANLTPRTIGTWQNPTAVILNDSTMKRQDIRPSVKLLNVTQCLSRGASSPRPILVSPPSASSGTSHSLTSPEMGGTSTSTTNEPQSSSSSIFNYAQTTHSSPRSIPVAEKRECNTCNKLRFSEDCWNDSTKLLPPMAYQIFAFAFIYSF